MSTYALNTDRNPRLQFIQTSYTLINFTLLDYDRLHPVAAVSHFGLGSES